jgi:transcriptional antiterminator RfaH
MSLEGMGELSETPGTWYVAHTRSRFEKVFAWEMNRLATPYFLPMVQRVKLSGGKKRRMMIPLFSSYLFICGDAETRRRAMETNRLCQIIEVPDQQQLVTELGYIQRAIAGRIKIDPYPQIAEGRRCRIIAGSLQGLEGVVVRRSNRALVVLEISMLGQGALLETDCDLVEVIDLMKAALMVGMVKNMTTPLSSN